MTEEEFEQKLTFILLESLIAIREIEHERRERIGELFDEFLSIAIKKSSYTATNIPFIKCPVILIPLWYFRGNFSFRCP